jgi:hypothetical protein
MFWGRTSEKEIGILESKRSEVRNTREVLDVTLERKSPLRRSRDKWEDTIKANLVEIAHKYINSSFWQRKGKTGGIM